MAERAAAPHGRLVHLRGPARRQLRLGRACELVVGTPAAGFRTELRWKVDWLPKRLFQFSTLILPDLDSDASLFAVYAMGIRGRNGATEIYVLDA